jgi:hypothetical protein
LITYTDYLAKTRDLFGWPASTQHTFVVVTADRGRYFVICCVDDLSIEIPHILLGRLNWQSPTKKQIVNELLKAAYSAKHIELALVVIDSLDETYVDPTLPPTGSLSPPFKGKDAKECCKLFREMTQRTNSDINYEYLVMDKRSTEDSTALLVVSIEKGNEIQSVRAVFEVVNLILLSMIAGIGSISENRKIIDAQPDGVFRIHPRPPKPKTFMQQKSAITKVLKPPE